MLTEGERTSRTLLPWQYPGSRLVWSESMLESSRVDPQGIQSLAKSLGSRSRTLLFGMLTLFGIYTSPVLAQDASDSEYVRVFLDCQTFGCDFDLVRREIDWVTWVRDREDADVHLFVTSVGTAAGTAFDIQFIGRGDFAGSDHSATHSSSDTDTQDERRRDLIERFKMGLIRYADETPAAEFLRIEYDRPDALTPDQITPENDPWNLWVFAASAGGSTRAQSRTSSASIRGSSSASRTSENWKFNWGARASYSEDDFELSDGSTTTSLLRSSGTDVLLVKSAGPHWGVGGRASITSSTFSNQDIRLNIQPTVEYNIFPYAESSRRQFTFQYRFGVSHVEYQEETIFAVTQETLYEQMLTASLGLQQPWAPRAWRSQRHTSCTILERIASPYSGTRTSVSSGDSRSTSLAVCPACETSYSCRAARRPTRRSC